MIQQRSLTILLVLLGLTLSAGASSAQSMPAGTSPTDPRTPIDLVICLDNSGSMKPLIDAARLSLWEIVNDLALLDPAPRLRVALVTYGGRENGHTSGYVRVRVPFTEDLDRVSESLFAVETGGGTENVGRAVKAALEELAWTPVDEDPLQLLFIAGNESADQDVEIDFRTMSYEAFNKNVELHAIFCGNENTPVAEGWKEMAELAGGHFATIELGSSGAAVGTPFDAQLIQLGASFSATQVALGDEGARALELQATQDRNAAALSSAAAAARAQTKAGALYAKPWDLVDAVASGSMTLAEIETSDLPADMRAMSPGELEDHIVELQQKREELQRQLRELAAQRREFLAAQNDKAGRDRSRTFDSVVRRAIREQVQQRGLGVERP